VTEVGDEFFDCPNLEVKCLCSGVVAILLVNEVCDWMFECSWGQQGWYCAVAVVVVVVTVSGNFRIEIKMRLFSLGIVLLGDD
jgi:hypothetical protein